MIVDCGSDDVWVPGDRHGGYTSMGVGYADIGVGCSGIGVGCADWRWCWMVLMLVLLIHGAGAGSMVPALNFGCVLALRTHSRQCICVVLGFSN